LEKSDGVEAKKAKAPKGWAKRVKADKACIKAINDLTAALNKDVIKPWKTKAGKKKPAKVAFTVNKAKLNTVTQAYIHSYLKATVLQAKASKKLLDKEDDKELIKKIEKMIKAMKKLVKKSKTKLNEAKDAEKAAAAKKKGSNTVVIVIVIVVVLLVVVGVVVYCKKKKGGEEK
jgi:cobalamin biosynthesis Mg chelatase CobN